MSFLLHLLVFPVVLLLSHCKTSNLSPVKPSRSESPSYHNWVTNKCGLTGCLVDGWQKANLSRLTSVSSVSRLNFTSAPFMEKTCIKRIYYCFEISISLSGLVKLTNRFRNYELWSIKQWEYLAPPKKKIQAGRKQ